MNEHVCFWCCSDPVPVDNPARTYLCAICGYWGDGILRRVQMGEYGRLMVEQEPATYAVGGLYSQKQGGRGMNDEIKIQISIIKPYEQARRFSLSVSGVLWSRAMAPLHKDHDLPLGFTPKSTRDQLMMRHNLCQDLGQMFADELWQIIAKQDPKNGYAPGSMTRLEAEG